MSQFPAPGRKTAPAKNCVVFDPSNCRHSRSQMDAAEAEIVANPHRTKASENALLARPDAALNHLRTARCKCIIRKHLQLTLNGYTALPDAPLELAGARPGPVYRDELSGPALQPLIEMRFPLQSAA
jgi:hypothetical protein